MALCLTRLVGLRGVLMLALGLTLFQGKAYAQGVSSESPPPKFWIFLTDKIDDAGVVAHSEPGYITDRALRRRELRGGRISVGTEDAPLSRRYLAELESHGVHAIIRSRWLNAVSAYLTPTQVKDIGKLHFVRRIVPVAARMEEPNPVRPGGADRPFFERHSVPLTSSLYGASFSQLSTMNAVAPLERGYAGRGVRLGFLDTLYDFNHPAFQQLVADGRLIEVRDFTGLPQANFHGLSVVSVAAGYAPGTLIGPAHQTEILAATTEYVHSETRQEEDFFVAGMEWLERMGADVVNVSLSYTTFDPGEENYTYADMDGQTAVTTLAANRAASLGVVVVTSAGNSGACGEPGPDCWYYVGSPADSDSVITVGAVRPDSTRALFSSYGPTADGRIKPDVVAMGVTVTGAVPGDAFNSNLNGTSFSGPLVAGVVSQMLEANPKLTPVEVRAILRNSAHQSGNPDNSIGWGIINADRAISLALGIETPETFAFLPPYPNPVTTTVSFTVDAGPESGAVELSIYDILGRHVAAPHNGFLPIGRNYILFDAIDLSPGVYLYRFTSSGSRESGTFVVVR